VTASYAAVITLLLTLAIVALALFVSGKRFAADASAATSKVYRVRAVYFVILAAAVVISLAFTLPMTPYPGKFGDKKPDVVVNVMSEMWSWSLASGSGSAAAGANLVLPAGKLVEFDVSSKDVNHNFAIYNSAGELVAQVQAMPDYTNRLFFTFDAPGHYYVLCLEYCGVAHHAMNVEFDVK
jgi:cytochrome c oxidase subunit II